MHMKRGILYWFRIKKVPCITFFTRLTDDEYAEHYFNFNVCGMSARLSFVKLQFSIKFSS